MEVAVRRFTGLNGVRYLPFFDNRGARGADCDARKNISDARKINSDARKFRGEACSARDIPHRADPCIAKLSSIMQNVIQIGQAQPTVLQQLETLVKSTREWLSAKSETFTALCGTEGDVFTHGDVVKAHLWLALLFILIGIGGAL